MMILLCKKSLDRIGAAGIKLVADLREREHTPVIKDCLDRCMGCDKGLLIAAADGLPMSAAKADKLLATIDAIAADDE
jgi:hypothetical protein